MTVHLIGRVVEALVVSMPLSYLSTAICIGHSTCTLLLLLNQKACWNSTQVYWCRTCVPMSSLTVSYTQLSLTSEIAPVLGGLCLQIHLMTTAPPRISCIKNCFQKPRIGSGINCKKKGGRLYYKHSLEIDSISIHSLVRAWPAAQLPVQCLVCNLHIKKSHYVDH